MDPYSSPYIGGFPKRGACSYKKDYNVLGFKMGSPYLGKLPYIP